MRAMFISPTMPFSSQYMTSTSWTSQPQNRTPANGTRLAATWRMSAMGAERPNARARVQPLVTLIFGRASWLSACEAAQDCRQDAALAVVVELDRAVDARDDLDQPLAAVVTDTQRDRLARRQTTCQAEDVVFLAPGQAERRRVLARLVLQRQHAHADQVRAMNALIALGEYGAHAEQRRALGRPVARRS